MKEILKNVGEVMSENGPTILTGCAVVGVFATAVMACKATPKAMQLLEEERAYGPLTTKDKIRVCWKVYLPAASVGVATAACIVAVNQVHYRRAAVITGLYSITEAALKEYQDKVVETIGTNKERKMRDEIDRDRVRANPISTNEVIATGLGDVLCYDALSGRYFTSEIEKIKHSLNKLNRELLLSNFVSLNDVYHELGLSGISLGENIGWRSDDGLIEPRFSSQLSEEDRPCLVMTFTAHPRFG